MRTPPAPGESKLPTIEAYLDERATTQLWKLIAYVRENDREVYNAFLLERSLLQLVVEAVASSAGMPTYADVAAALVAGAASDRKWIVQVPLANALAPARYQEVAPDTGLARPTQSRDWSRDDPEDSSPNPYTVRGHLGDDVSFRARWDRGDDTYPDLDTRIGAVLVFVIDRTEHVALTIARSRAHYALAVWCLLKPPGDDPTREMWPSLGDWVPRPSWQVTSQTKAWVDQRQGGRVPLRRRHAPMLTEHDLYHLSDDTVQLEAPFRAIAHAPTRRSARALLGAAWHLFVASRTPADLERTDQALHLQAAIEALCEPGHSVRAAGSPVPVAAPSETELRWQRLLHRKGVRQQLRRYGYSQGEIRGAAQLTQDVRNINAHAADAVLVNLGFPSSTERRMRDGRDLGESELSLAVVASSLPVIREAVELATRALLEDALANDFDDAAFERTLS